MPYVDLQKKFNEFDHFVTQIVQKCPVTIEGEKYFWKNSTYGLSQGYEVRGKIFLILLVQTTGFAPLINEGKEISHWEEIKKKMQYDNLPKELRKNGKFCLWNYEERQGQEKPAKVPYQMNGNKAQPNNEKHSQIMPLLLM